MKLSEPLVFRNGVRGPNRAVLAPMTNHQSNEDGTLGDAELRWLERRADGGFGTIITCAAHVAPEGQGWTGELGIFGDLHDDGLARLASSMTRKGALPIIQLYHGGYRSPPDLIGGRPRGPSEIERWASSALSDTEIVQTAEAFVTAAARAERAGFAGVELHGAHGYLITQFLSVRDNQRTDRWGGSLENRARLLRMIVTDIRQRVSEKFLVGVRVSPEDNRAARGIDLDESLQIARWLEADGVDFLHLSLWDWKANTLKRPDEHVIPSYRTVVSDKVMLIVAGNIWTTEDVEGVLALGADGVAVGRAAVIDADWPRIVSSSHRRATPLPVTAEQLLSEGLTPYFVKQLRAYKDPILLQDDALSS
jgi:2,4-dienoyl-CoA reductase-like NADH-dependent reductase (Old Yellow Enzyme family)